MCGFYDMLISNVTYVAAYMLFVYRNDLKSPQKLIHRASIKTPIGTLAKSLITEYAHQSSGIENNRLDLGESVRIGDRLADTLFQTVNIPSLHASDLVSAPMLSAQELLPEQDSSQVAEMRNHIIASQWVTEVAAR